MTTARIRPTRFAHLEGHTDICYSEDGRHIITCGLDGDVRIFKGLDDDDCVTHTVAEEVHCVAFRNDSIITGTNLNIVQSYTLDEGKPNGIITRCTDFPTHINISKDKKLIAVASSDMTVKVHDTENFKDLIFSGHEAPVLSVALDPRREFLASSSCDGTVRVWNFCTQTLVHSFPLLPKSNDFSFSTTLCRLCWTVDGQYLIVPVNSEIQSFNRNTWKVEFTLSHSSIEGVPSVTTVSPCGQYVASGCRDGRIIVWDIKQQSCIATEKSHKGMAITGLVWHPARKDELAFVNSAGEFGTMENILRGHTAAVCSETLQKKNPNRKEEVNEGPIDVFPPLDLPDGAEDDDEISIAKIKSQLGFADDEEGTFVGIPKTEGDSNISRPPSRIDTPVSAPTVVTPKLPEPQKPFQPGMSPEHLGERYMVWNNTGIVRQYQSEEEQSIEVEFHDSSIHHALHLNNHFGHSMAALNNEALALVSESQDDQLSKLVVHHFSAWDGSKEWQTEMVEGEDILATGIGIGWVAVATDLRNLRIFTTTGIQRGVLSIPGPVVCLAGFEKNIMIVFHSGIGVLGEQNMSVMILNVNGHKHPMPTPVPVSLAPRSFLAWAGFTDEGTPMIMDSTGVVKLFNKTLGQSWTPVLNTKAHGKGKSDHYFILGASEIQGMVRCILCKGSRYPPVLPRPHVSLLDLKTPLCEPESEKSCLEEKMIRAKLLSSTIDSLAKDGFDVDGPLSETNKMLRETMVKLFALACRADRESRGVEICELMPSADMVEVGVKYAAKLHRMQLAERLNDVVQRKVEENLNVEEEDHEGETFSSSHRRKEDGDSEDIYECRTASATPSFTKIESQQTKENLIKRNPLLAASCKQNSNKESLLDRMPLTPSTRNPFKRASTSSASARGMQVLDNLKIAKKEDTSSLVLKPVLKKPKTKQSSLSGVCKDALPSVQQTGKENMTNNTECQSAAEAATSAVKTTPVAKKISALKLWLEDNREMLKVKFPNASETELLAKSALLFKDVEDTIKRKYKSMAAELSRSISDTKEGEKSSVVVPVAEEKKRKQESVITDEPMDKRSKLVHSKLAEFSFSRKE